MKVKLLIVLVSMLFIGCQNDDAVQNNEAQTESIEGTWHLKNVHGGLIPIDINYNLGEVKWTFNEAESHLVIENNIISTGPEDIYAGLDSGTYSYEIQLINDAQILFIDGNQIGVLLMTADTLAIDNGLALDGYLSNYER